MEREVFKSKPHRGILPGLLRGFTFGCIILLTALAFGMDEDKFIPLLAVGVILSGIIGFICCIGKRVEADEKGIYTKKRQFLFAENDMNMQVHTHYYSFLAVTERYINVSGKDGRHEVKCSFLGSRDAGRLAKIIEDSMRKKYRSVYDDAVPGDTGIRTFVIPAAELTERIDKNIWVGGKVVFWFLTVVYSWILISMIVQEQLADQWLWVLLPMLLNALILGSINLTIKRKYKKSEQNIPCEIVFFGGMMYIDGRSFGSVDVTRVYMTPERGEAKGDMRKLVICEMNGNTSEYSFGFRADRKTYPEYVMLTEAVKDHFGDKFAYDIR